MSSYCYSSLPEGSIRLLRLLPHQDERSPIQCQLFDLTLMDSETTYPYEALSYVWGSEDNRQSISVDNCDLHIGANLHAALSHLRDRFLERIIWVDAICINQGDSNEKGQQVLSMARIYAKASCVIVWLGEAAADSDQALEDVRIAAAKQSTKSSMNETNQQAILTLLHRSWFQRIWVLQEVAAARHVLIKCGPTEIDGYAFCSGLSASKLSYATCPDLQALIRSVTYLIRGAIFRPRCAAGGSGRFSLDIRPLSELVEMYHTRKATERHDKVYALLGMSSDDPSAAGLLADYKIPWRQLFQQLVNFFLSERVSVDTWDDKEMAVIQGKGRVLGEVSLVERDTAWEDRQTVEITWRNSYIKEEWVSRWTFQASAKSIQVGDAVCLLQGTSRPTIVRLCNCYWAVIMIAVPPTDDLRAKSGGIKWSELLRSITAFPHDFLLVWDWDMRPDEPNHEAYEYFISNQVLNSCKTEDHLHNATRLGNIGLVLQDMQRYEEAENHLRKAMEVFEEALRSMESLELTYEDQGERKSGVKNVELVVGLLVKVEGGWPLLRWAAEDGHEAVVKLLLGKANPNFKDEDGRTPVLWAATNGHDVVVKLLLSTGKVGLNAKDKGGRTPLLWAAKNGHQTVVKLLLDTGRVDPDAKDGGEVKGGRGRTPLLWAAEGGHEAV
ncbi:heterokaryon incompatibility protein-domain-containing protein, partial [Dactylonectria macrodidyma]